MKIVIRDGLKMPESFIEPEDLYQKDWCGSGWNQNIVPDYIFDVCVKLAGCIHDYCYEKQIGKKLADSIFYYNLLALIKKKNCNMLENYLEIATAKIYYYSVKAFGQDYYNKCRIKKQ